MSLDANSVFGKEFSSSQEPDGGSGRQRAKQNPAFPFENVSAASAALTPPPPQPPVFTGADWLDANLADIQPSSADRLLPKLKGFIRNTLSDQVTPLRFAGHLSVLAVAAVILLFSQVKMPNWDISTFRTIPGNALLNRVGDARSVQAHGLREDSVDVAPAGDDSLQKAAVPFTIIPDRPREEIEIYQVQAGDTVLAIAESFGLQPETIQWSNPGLEQNPDLLRIGDKLKILPVDGILYTVVPGDTLSSLASKFKVDITAITGYTGNKISDPNAALVSNTELVIPGGVKPYVPKQVVAYDRISVPTDAIKGSGSFTWPGSGSVSQRFWSGHPAIDLAGWTGAPVKASDNGYVILAGGGWNGGYGNHVIVDHGNGFVTLYAHLNSIFVRPGENVERGQQIGTVGNTGNSTGPHLHFEIRYQDVPLNPFEFLP